MISYFKKVVLLKKVVNSSKNLKGLSVIESLNSKTNFTFNFSSNLNNDYSIYISNESDKIIEITKNNESKFKVFLDNFNANSGVTIAVFCGTDLVCHGNYGNSFYDLNGITNYAKKKFIKNDKEQNFKAEDTTAFNVEKTTSYDDECIATENYYKINDESKSVRGQDATLPKSNKKAEEIEENALEFREYETDSSTKKECGFYEKIKDKLSDIFNEFERCNDLNETLPNSEFVKIHYAENKFYYVGKIYENNLVKYLCYGVIGYLNEMPNELLNNFSFVPISNYELSGKGFYLIFQDAKTGEILKKQEN